MDEDGPQLPAKLTSLHLDNDYSQLQVTTQSIKLKEVSRPSPAGLGDTIHRAGIFPHVIPQQAWWGFFILWMLVSYPLKYAFVG